MVACGNDLRSQRSLPKAEWAANICAFDLYGSNPHTVEVNWPSYGMMQTVVVLSGCAVFAGIPSMRVPGATYAEKRASVMQETIDDIHDNVKASGFYIKFTDGDSQSGACGLLIPSGLLVITASSNLRAPRWSLVADEADAGRVRETLRQVLERLHIMS